MVEKIRHNIYTQKNLISNRINVNTKKLGYPPSYKSTRKTVLKETLLLVKLVVRSTVQNLRLCKFTFKNS